MKNKKYYLLIAVLSIIFLSIFIVSSYTKTEYPNDFNFTYSFGANGKESIDTYSNILKYSSENGMMEIKFKLSKEDKNSIYLKMVESSFMSMPKSFPKILTFSIEPVERSTLSVEYLNDTNQVSWNTNNFDLTNLDNPTHGNEELKVIQEIGILIQQIISERTKSMNLPAKAMNL